MNKSIIPKKIDELIEQLKKIKNNSNIAEFNIEITPEEYKFTYNSGAIGQYDTIITFHYVNYYNKEEAQKIEKIFL